MENSQYSISELLTSFVKRISEDEEAYSLIGIVSNIDEVKNVCDVAPISGDAEILDVRLNASQNESNGVFEIPKDGSFVAITFLSVEVAFISMCSIVDKYRVIINGTTLEIQEGSTVFNGGDNGGLIKIDDLVKTLNDSITSLNTELSKIATGISSAGGAYVPSPLTPIIKNDFEDTNITH